MICLLDDLARKILEEDNVGSHPENGEGLSSLSKNNSEWLLNDQIERPEERI